MCAGMQACVLARVPPHYLHEHLRLHHGALALSALGPVLLPAAYAACMLCTRVNLAILAAAFFPCHRALSLQRGAV